MDIKEWLKTLQGTKPKAFINLKEATGIGDSLNATPAIRHFKEAHPNHLLTVVVDDFFKNQIFANNPYIDFLVPANNANIHWNDGDVALNCHWSFFEQHQYPPSKPHVCGSYDWFINGKHSFDWQMEMFQNQNDIFYVESIVKKIPKEKPWVVVFPNYTMFNRMLPQRYWQEIVERLNKKYTVISLGGSSDFKLDNVIDLRCKFKINQIPKFLDYVDIVYTCCSGSLHISGCNPKVKIVLLSSGEFPSELHVPYRNGSVGWNCEIIEHSCPQKEECYIGHIKETEYQKQLKTNIMKYGDKYPTEILKKYSAWTYCVKKNDKYSCSRLVMKNLLDSGLLPE